jgi:hypothetical protein
MRRGGTYSDDMANPFGSGTAIVIPLPKRESATVAEPILDEASTARVREAKPAPVTASDPPEVSELLARITTLLQDKPEEGMTATELRVALSERPEALQRALAAGLRARRLRRSGSRCRLHYLLND